MNSETSHVEIIKKISLNHFGKEPSKIERMKTGINNEVYSIKVEAKDYIFRLNTKDSIKGSSVYIPIFKSKKIKVPDIIAKDYSKTVVPYNYQILTKLEGADIDEVISTLSNEELENIANETAIIVKKLITLPTNNRFGYTGIGIEKFKPTWKEVLEEILATIKNRTEKTGAVKSEYVDMFQNVLDIYDDYFKKAPSQFYFDDMCTKNVIINRVLA